MQSIKSGSVFASSNHCSNARDDCINASTLLTSGHSMTCSAVSTWIVQHGHSSLWPSWWCWHKFLLVAEIFITCLHVHSWNSLGTSLFSVQWTFGQSTLSKASVNIPYVSWKNKRATCHPAVYRLCGPASGIIFFPSTNMHISLKGNASCWGRSVMSCFWIIAFAPALQAAFIAHLERAPPTSPYHLGEPPHGNTSCWRSVLSNSQELFLGCRNACSVKRIW